ncbi:hypothetical protein [Halobaculum rubrum]|uniref:hypothetical protein n=1 Tax=Halobaculum rubrum TaxID=2872158 RepID=UPI001CA44F9C|nr:hypothetical protein [Halobaculum rubrum]QZX99449.1 hypothetical protein K6T25_14585 [Halobaculum rubrum]
MSESADGDPSVIRRLAVTTDDVIAALEARDRGRREAVLRVTPPFSGRMRARLHIAGAEGAYESDGDAEPIHVDPRAFLPDGFPRFPGSGAEGWRSAARESLQERIEVDSSDGPLTVRVRYLG